ncbi:19120_t:CDS:2, partial [Funneliformis geosporum]
MLYSPQPGLCDQCKFPFINNNMNRKSTNTFTLEDLIDDNNMKIKTKKRDDENSRKIDKTLDILSKLIIEVNQIEN